MNQASVTLPKIWVVEDDIDDQYFIEQAFSFSDVDLHFYENGEAVWKELNDGNLPDFVITDINMPKVDGFELIESFRKKEATLAIPMIVLSTSSSPNDIKRAYQLGANAYVVKPDDLRTLRDVCTSLAQFWSLVAH